MAVVKLPSGRTVKIPDGKTEQQAVEYIFNKLEGNADYADDREKLGDRLETSGWGSTIGGTIGSIAGGIGGIFTAPSLVVNPVTLGAAGGAAGSAIGEGIEQWITGKGEGSDVAREGLIGGAFGVIPGAGGQVAKNVIKAGGKKTAASLAGAGTGAGIGAGAGYTGAALTGGDKSTGATVGAVVGAAGGSKLVDKVLKPIFGKAKKSAGKILHTVGVKSSSKTAPVDEMLGGFEKIFTGKLKTLIGRPTGAFETVQGILDVRRGLVRAATNWFTKKYKRPPNAAEKQILEDAAERSASAFSKEYKADKGLRSKIDKSINPASAKPKVQILRDPKSNRRYYEDELGNKIDADTGKPFGKSYAVGGLVEDTTDVLNKYVLGPKTQITSDQLKTGVDNVTDFIPVVGDVKAFVETLDAFEKGQYATAGLLGAGAAVGLIPGVGDVLNKAAKTLARKYGKKLSPSDAATIIRESVVSGKPVDPEIARFAKDIEQQLEQYSSVGAKKGKSGHKGLEAEVIMDDTPPPGLNFSSGYEYTKHPDLPYGTENTFIIGPGKIRNMDDFTVYAHELGHAKSPKGRGLLDSYSGSYNPKTKQKGKYGPSTLTSETYAWRSAAQDLKRNEPSPEQAKKFTDTVTRALKGYIQGLRKAKSKQDVDPFTQKIINKIDKGNLTLDDLIK